jgi:hypothetical protein
MTVRRTPPDRNSPGDTSSDERSVPHEHPPLLTARAALILIAALATGIAAGILAHLAGGHPASAVLAGGAACGGALALLNTIIS